MLFVEVKTDCTLLKSARLKFSKILRIGTSGNSRIISRVLNVGNAPVDFHAESGREQP